MNKILDQNLRLQSIDATHAEELFRLTDVNREYLRQWLPWVDSTISVNDTLDFIKSCKEQSERNDGFQSAIVLDEKIVGMIGLVCVNNLSKKAEIGYWLSASHQGKGIMTKSCKAVVEYCFDTLNLNKIIIHCAVENKASQGIPKRLNFKTEGILRQDGFLNGKFVDHIRYAMLREEWEKV